MPIHDHSNSVIFEVNPMELLKGTYLSIKSTTKTKTKTNKKKIPEERDSRIV